MKTLQNSGDFKISGIASGIAAYTMWGLFPLYWKLLVNISPYEILAHRIVWSCVFTFFLLAVRKQLASAGKIFKNPKTILYLIASGVLVSLNWGIYIWAVNNGRILESSLGYYLNPLLSVLHRCNYFHERFDVWLGVALLLALAGIAIFIVKLNSFPWISLSLALSFAVYGALKKVAKVDNIIALMLETLSVSPIALWYILSINTTSAGAFYKGNILTIILLIFAGVVTSIPLLLYADGVKKLPLTVMGFLQYISPTGQFLLGVLVYHEQFTGDKAITFAFVLTGLIIFMATRSGVRKIPEESLAED